MNSSLKLRAALGACLFLLAGCAGVLCWSTIVSICSRLIFFAGSTETNTPAFHFATDAVSASNSCAGVLCSVIVPNPLLCLK